MLGGSADARDGEGDDDERLRGGEGLLNSTVVGASREDSEACDEHDTVLDEDEVATMAGDEVAVDVGDDVNEVQDDGASAELVAKVEDAMGVVVEEEEEVANVSCVGSAGEATERRGVCGLIWRSIPKVVSEIVSSTALLAAFRDEDERDALVD